jgi:hypothetical protein
MSKGMGLNECSTISDDAPFTTPAPFSKNWLIDNPVHPFRPLLLVLKAICNFHITKSEA